MWVVQYFKNCWSGHKRDMEQGLGKCCHFCEHWSRYHRGNFQDLSGVQIYFLDSCEDPGEKENGFPKLRKLEDQWMVNLGSLASLDPVNECNGKDDKMLIYNKYTTNKILTRN